MNDKLINLIKYTVSAICITSILLTLTVLKMKNGSTIDTATFSEVMLSGIFGLTVVGWKAHDKKQNEDSVKILTDLLINKTSKE